MEHSVQISTEHFLCSNCDFNFSDGFKIDIKDIWNSVNSSFNKKDWNTLKAIYLKIILIKIELWESAVIGLIEVLLIQDNYTRAERVISGISPRISSKFYHIFLKFFKIVLNYLQEKSVNIENFILLVKKEKKVIEKQKSNFDFAYLNKCLKNRLKLKNYQVVLSLENNFCGKKD